MTGIAEPWAFLVILWMEVVFLCWVTGLAFIHITWWIFLPGRGRARLDRWQLYEEAIVISNVWMRFAALMALVAVWGAVLFFFHPVIPFLLEDHIASRIVTTTFVGAAFGGYASEFLRLVAIAEKARALDRLPRGFRTKLTILDLAALYDSLQYAPLIYWQGFSKLDPIELNRGTADRYFRYAELYLHRRSLHLARTAIIIAVVLGVTATITAAVLDLVTPETFWGGG